MARSIRVRAAARERAPVSQTSTQRPHRVHKESLCPISGEPACDSGFEHQAQRRGHPLKNTVVLTPGPSCREKRWMLNTGAVPGGLLVSHRTMCSRPVTCPSMRAEFSR